jgi:hypothetical protein
MVTCCSFLLQSSRLRLYSTMCTNLPNLSRKIYIARFWGSDSSAALRKCSGIASRNARISTRKHDPQRACCHFGYYLNPYTLPPPIKGPWNPFLMFWRRPFRISVVVPVVLTDVSWLHVVDRLLGSSYVTQPWIYRSLKIADRLHKIFVPVIPSPTKSMNRWWLSFWVKKHMYHQQMHYFIFYSYCLLHSSCMFRRYYLAIFRELTPKFL